MLSNDFDLFDTNDCPGCHNPLMAYRYECARWNGVVWHVRCALREADELLEQPTANPGAEWVAAKYRLPEKEGFYLVFAESEDPDRPLIEKTWYENGLGWSLIPSVWAKAITHWMPLPAKPNSTDR